MVDKFADSLRATSAFFSEYVARLAADGIDLRELNDLDECLDAFKTVIQEERERIEQALEDAGGRDCQGDTNRAQKIKVTPESAAEYVQNLKV